MQLNARNGMTNPHSSVDRDRVAAEHRPHHEAGNPDGADAQHQCVVPQEDRAAHADVFLGREDQLLPPHLDEVVEALSEAGAIDALEEAAALRCGLPLFHRHRHPHLVATFEVRETVVRHVVADVPERKRRERRQERDAADDLVEPVVTRVAAVAGVMTDDKQPRDGDRGRNDHQCLRPPGAEVNRAGDAGAEEHEI